MFTPLFWLSVAINVWFVLMPYRLVKGYLRKRFVYSLKREINAFRFFLTIIWVLYFLIGVAATIPWVNQWAEACALQQTDELARALLMIAPLVYVLSAFGITIKVAWSACDPFWRYNVQEQEWEKESEEKTKARLHKLMFWKRKTVA